jgi:hypothetical protein
MPSRNFTADTSVASLDASSRADIPVCWCAGLSSPKAGALRNSHYVRWWDRRIPTRIAPQHGLWPSSRSAGFQPAVSPTSNRQVVCEPMAWEVRSACGLETRDTADWKSALRSVGAAHPQSAVGQEVRPNDHLRKMRHLRARSRFEPMNPQGRQSSRQSSRRRFMERLAGKLINPLGNTQEAAEGSTANRDARAGIKACAIGSSYPSLDPAAQSR